MHLENISLINFKNYSELNIGFSREINCFLGENGSGKTNLLDAIYYLSLTKSAFNSLDQQNIKHGASFFSIKGNFDVNDKKFEIHCVQKLNQKKSLKINKAEYDRLSEHVGKFPVVLIAPDDTGLIRLNSDSRRRFLDSFLSQLSSAYLHNIIRYNQVLRHRNSLLKQFAQRNYLDYDLLEPYDNQLLELAETIYKERKSFISLFKPIFLEHYQFLSGGKEEIDIIYQSDINQEKFKQLFFNSRKKDLLLQRTTFGVHKDDLVFEIEKYPLKKFGSQGQQKSFLIALKLAQYTMLKEEKKFKPILLLDDIFDKLDDQRISKLLDLVSGGTFGQLFITDARPERTEQIFSTIQAELKIFKIADGAIISAG